jgi:hypothetical protein
MKNEECRMKNEYHSFFHYLMSGKGNAFILNKE